MARPLSVAHPIAVVLLVALVLHAHPAASQTTTATLQGSVRDASQAMLPGATVTLRDINTGFVRSTTSDRAGRYVLSFVPAGAYELTVELSGFKTLKREGLRFEVGQDSTIDATLEVSTLEETVTVRGETPLVSTTKASVDQIISREQIDRLPLGGRQASSLALLAPGVVSTAASTSASGEVATGGQPRGSSELLVDGVSNELMAVNSIRSTAPPDAIQEFQVITSQYQAEFGHASGLILNTITRSGTNDLHGRLYYFHRDEGLDARNAFATSKASFEQKQGGGWLGGPLVRDRTHYFATYEATRRLTIATVTSPLARGDYERPHDNNQLLAKVSHQLTSNHRLVGRFSLDRPVTHNQGVGQFNLPEVGYDAINEDFTYAGTVASVLSNRALNELRVQVSDARIGADHPNPDAFTINRPTSVSGKLSNIPQAFAELRVQLVDNFSYERGAHRIKVGFDVNRVTLDGYVYQNVPGVFIFNTDRPFDPADLTTYPTSFIGNTGDPSFYMVSTGVSLFAQDTWHLPRHVTLNLGVRYDGWEVTGFDLRKNNLAPRLGVAWDPFGTNKTAIRAGVGVFYNNVLTNAPLFAHFLGSQVSVQIINPGYPDPFTRGTTAAQPPLSTYIAEPDQPLPRAYQTTLGVQREILPGVSVGADYVNSKGRQLLRVVDTNPVTLPTFTRPDPTRGFVRVVESTGYSDYHGLLVNGKGRLGSRGLVQLAYTLSAYKTTTESEAQVFQQDDLTKDDSYGYGNNDQLHRVVIGGYVTLPWEFEIGAVLTARSGTPFNITVGSDNNRNGTNNDRPDLASGARVGTDDMRDRANFINPVNRPGNLPRNAGRSDGQWTLDARVGKRFTVRGWSAEALLEAFNVTNRVNFGTLVGNLASPLFGRPNSASDARQVQLGLRFDF